MAQMAASQPPSGWQPIETLPPDTLWFIGCADSVAICGLRNGVIAEIAVDQRTGAINLVEELRKITHWMPLPDAPPAAPRTETEPAK